MSEAIPPAPVQPSALRIDKWLWAVRLFKTRSIATEACRAGHVKIDGQNVKPARAVRVGEIVVARANEITRTVKVLGLAERRMGAKSVPCFLDDLTPPEELAKRTRPSAQPVFLRPRGIGRPTKKDRRELSKLTRRSDGPV